MGNKCSKKKLKNAHSGDTGGHSSTVTVVTKKTDDKNTTLMVNNKEVVVSTQNYNEFIKMLVGPATQNISSMEYLIGYKMTYLVDINRKRIPGIIVIATLKIPQRNNMIYQSESKHSVVDYVMLQKNTKNVPFDKPFTRDQQAESLKHTGGNMFAWEHSRKYCSRSVETLGLTFCGKLGDVINASKLYDKQECFAESAYTSEENINVGTFYEVGVTLTNNGDPNNNNAPFIGKGKCLTYYHWFLSPVYAMDYGFWQFQINDGLIDVNKSELVLTKQFKDLRQVSKNIYYNNIPETNHITAGANSSQSITTGVNGSQSIMDTIYDSQKPPPLYSSKPQLYSPKPPSYSSLVSSQHTVLSPNIPYQKTINDDSYSYSDNDNDQDNIPNVPNNEIRLRIIKPNISDNKFLNFNNDNTDPNPNPYDTNENHKKYN
jgi:hypothetical protein